MKKRRENRRYLSSHRFLSVILILVLCLTTSGIASLAADDPASQNQNVLERDRKTDTADSPGSSSRTTDNSQKTVTEDQTTDDSQKSGTKDQTTDDGQKTVTDQTSDDGQKTVTSQTSDNGSKKETSGNVKETGESTMMEEETGDISLSFDKTGVHYLQMPEGNLLILDDDGLIRYDIPAKTVNPFIEDGILDVESLETALVNRNKVSINGASRALAANNSTNSPALYAEIPEGEAWIDAERYFRFLCESKQETDLNAEVQKRLKEDYNRNSADVPAGLLRNTLPQYIESNRAEHTFLNARVKGVTIHRVGLLSISGVQYVYYTTDHEVTPDTLYAVLTIDSSTDMNNLTKEEKEELNKEKIEVRYEHVTGHQLKYEIEVLDKDGVESSLPEGWNEDRIFGEDDRPLALNGDENESPHATVPVNIPRGFTATVKAEFVAELGGGTSTVPIRFKNGNKTLDSLSIGVKRQYNDSGTMTHPSENNGERDTRSDHIYVQCTHGSAHDQSEQGDVVITVTLQAYEVPKFSAEWWLLKSGNAKGMYNFYGRDENGNPLNGVDKDTNKEWYKGEMDIQGGAANETPADNVIKANASVDAKGSDPGPYSFTWQINGLATASNMGGADGTNNTLIDKLEINGESISVPLIPEIDKVGSDVSPGKETVSATETTVLSSGTKVTLKVQGHFEFTRNQQPLQVRTYTLTVENCYEDITISGGRFIWNAKKQLIIRGDGVSDLQTWEHAKAAGKDTSADYWETYSGTAASWKDLGELENVVDRTNDNKNANWFTDPIRFKRGLGYQKPHIRVLAADSDANENTSSADQAYIVLQNDDTLTAEGKKLLGNTGLAVELVNLKNTNSFDSTGKVPQSDVQYNPGKTAPYDYIGRAEDGSNNWIYLCGWANLVKDSSYSDSGFWGEMQSPPIYGQNGVRQAYNAQNSENMSWNNLVDGFYYIRTTKELDQYMRKDINNGQIIIEITAEPIRAAIQYKDGTGKEDAPAAGTTINNMPYQKSTPAGYDNGGDKENGKLGGYNVVDNDVIYIPTGVPSDSKNQYVFQCWQLVKVGSDGATAPVDGYTFQPGQTIQIKDVLSGNLTEAYKTQGSGDNQRAVFTLEAVWVSNKEYTGSSIPITVNYHMVDDDHNAATLFYSENIGAVRQTDAWADIFEEDGVTLNEKVLEILKNKSYDTENSYYMLYPANEGEKFYSRYYIDGVDADNAVMDVYLVKVFPISDIRVEKKWTTNNNDGSIPPQAVPKSIQVQLQRRSGEKDDWKNVGSPVTLGVSAKVEGDHTVITTGEHSWKQFKYADDEKTQVYQYRVIEVKAGDVSITLDKDQKGSFEIPDSTAPNKPFKFKVEHTYTDPDNYGDENTNLTWETKIENEYQDQNAENGSLKITKKVANESSNQESFQFEVKLKLPEEKTWIHTDNVSGGTVTAGADDTYMFNLQKNQSIVFEKLPAGTVCTIKEILTTSQSYITNYDGNDTVHDDGTVTSTIYKDRESDVTVTNTAMGKFSVEKKVLGIPGDHGTPSDKWIGDTKFQIHVDFTFPEGVVLTELTGTDGDGEPITKELTYKSGRTYRLALELNNGTGRFTFDVPVGTTYTAHEHPSEFYDFVGTSGGTSMAGDVDEEGNTTGEISRIQTDITFTNQRTTGSLKVSKEVKGDYASRNKDFTFKLQFFESSEAITEQFAVSQAEQSKVNFDQTDGTYTITLKDQEDVTFLNIPSGVTYKIAEDASSGYTVQHQANGGDLHNGAATEELTIRKDANENTTSNTIRYINTRTNIPDTGIGSLGTPGIPTAGVILLSGAAAGASIFRSRRRKPLCTRKHHRRRP